MSYETDFYHSFKPFLPEKGQQKTWLTGYHVVTDELKATYPGAIDFMRDSHRRQMGDAIVKVMYDGWMPYCIEWIEGDLPHELAHVSRFEHGYHFYTKVYLAAWHAYPLNRKDWKPFEQIEASTMQSHYPKMPT